MWQDDELNWNSKKPDHLQKGFSDPHPDYAENLQTALNFIRKTAGSLLPGMKVAVTGSHNLKDSLLTISYTSPRHTPIGNWAVPIFLHQSKHQFNETLEREFNGYMVMVRKFEHRLNREIEKNHLK